MNRHSAKEATTQVDEIANLRDELRVLRDAIDELRDVVTYAVQNGRIEILFQKEGQSIREEMSRPAQRPEAEKLSKSTLPSKQGNLF